MFLSRSKKQYPAIEPYIHGAVYTASPYTMHFMEHINYEYLRKSIYCRVSLTALADLMSYAAYGTYQYDDYMTHLRKHAKRLGCQIEDMTEQGNDWIYDIDCRYII